MNSIDHDNDGTPKTPSHRRILLQVSNVASDNTTIQDITMAVTNDNKSVITTAIEKCKLAKKFT